MADHDTHDHTGIPGVGGSSDLDTIIAASAGEDIADALAGAASPTAGNVFATMADVGGGSVATPTAIQAVNYPQSNATSGAAITVAAASVGHRFVLGIGLINRAATGVSSTNTTWTLVDSKVQGNIHIEVWVGVVAGGSSGTTITITSGSTDWLNAQVIEIADTLTPTLGNHSETSGSASNDSAYITSSVVTTAGQVVVGMFGSANGSGNNAAFNGVLSALMVTAPVWPGQMMITYGQGRPAIFGASKGINVGSDWASLIAVIT